MIPKEEQEYWMKHYPHEAETIITLCGLFDETQDEAAKAQISYAIGVLRKKEKYAFHDLRKNPEDLPMEKGTYLVAGTLGGQKFKYWTCEFADYGTFRGWVLGASNPHVIAWRYIEPFEEDKE